MSNADQTVAVTLQIPKGIYQQASETAAHEQRQLEELLGLLIVEGLYVHTTVQQSLELVSAQYRDRLDQEGKLDQSPAEVLQELGDLREQVANELYPE